jgi:hypothetical protein
MFSIKLGNVSVVLGNYGVDAEGEKAVRKRVQGLTSRMENERKTLGNCGLVWTRRRSGTNSLNQTRKSWIHESPGRHPELS